MEAARARGTVFLNPPDSYYDSLKAALAKSKVVIKEDFERIRANKILIDYDDNGYLLQIFTKVGALIPNIPKHAWQAVMAVLPLVSCSLLKLAAAAFDPESWCSLCRTALQSSLSSSSATTTKALALATSRRCSRPLRWTRLIVAICKAEVLDELCR